MPAIKVPTNFNIDLDFEVPEFHRRLFAWLIDVIIQIAYLIVASNIYESYVLNNFTQDTLEDAPWISRMILWPLVTYNIASEIIFNGQTIGKKIFSLRVVNENGGKASISQYLIRGFLRTTDFVFLIILLQLTSQQNPVIALLICFGVFFMDIILVATSKKGQRLGDIVAHTILIRTNPKGSMSDTVFLEVADNYIPSFPQIMQLNDRDINAIKSILDTARKKDDFVLAANASEKIKHHLKIQSHLSPYDFLSVLLKDYNYLSTK